MIELLTGVPGSGKTCFAVHRLSSALEKRDRPIFTNINLLVPYDDVLQPLDVQDFHQFCKDELAFYDRYRDAQSIKIKEESIDEPLNYDEELKNSGLLDKYGNALIIWDECHNDLSDLDDSYLRWMSYHRHFEGMDVLLITQNLSLIARKYKGFVDKYYFAQNAAKRLFSTTFKYKVYTDHREYTKFHIEDISLASDKKIFALYDSGHYKVNRSAALKKFLPIIVLILFLFLFVKYFFFGYLMHRNDQPALDQNVSVSPVPVSQPVAPHFDQNDPRLDQLVKEYDSTHSSGSSGVLLPPPALQTTNGSRSVASPSSSNQSALARYFVRFTCTRSYCYFSGNRFTIPLASMDRFFTEFGGKVLMAEPINSDLSVVSAVVPAELYYMIQSHNIQSRSDNYGTYKGLSNGSNTLTAPQFSANTGI